MAAQNAGPSRKVASCTATRERPLRMSVALSVPCPAGEVLTQRDDREHAAPAGRRLAELSPSAASRPSAARYTPRTMRPGATWAEAQGRR